jgi:transcriptional regulator with XRE-family HTH domain
MSIEERIDIHLVAAAFGRVLREARRTRMCSQGWLAERAGIHPSYPSLLERGLRTPSLPIVIAIGAGLEIDAEILVARTVSILRANGTLPPPEHRR